MSKPELIAAYISGRIGRRAFMRSLTALGVSATAAAAYARSLAPGASAAGLGRDRSGLRVRGQDDYPVPGDLIEFIQLLIRVLEFLLAILGGGFATAKMAPLRLQGDSELDPADVDELETLQSQLSSHRDALRTLLSDLGGDELSEAVPEFVYDNSEDALVDLQTGLEASVEIFAGALGSSTTEPAALSTLASIGLVQARHISFVNRLLGDQAFPATFQQAATPEEVDAVLAGLGG
jgi:hypothetical protein